MFLPWQAYSRYLQSHFKIEIFEARAKSFKNMSILDYGSGSGALVAFLLDNKYGQLIHGYEPNAQHVKESGKFFPTTKGLIFQHETKLKRYDIIISQYVIGYVDRKKFFKQMFKYLKKDGYLILETSKPGILDYVNNNTKGFQKWRFSSLDYKDLFDLKFSSRSSIGNLGFDFGKIKTWKWHLKILIDAISSLIAMSDSKLYIFKVKK